VYHIPAPTINPMSTALFQVLAKFFPDMALMNGSSTSARKKLFLARSPR